MYVVEWQKFVFFYEVEMSLTVDLGQHYKTTAEILEANQNQHYKTTAEILEANQNQHYKTTAEILEANQK